jgi:hypothetical protein
MISSFYPRLFFDRQLPAISVPYNNTHSCVNAVGEQNDSAERSQCQPAATCDRDYSPSLKNNADHISCILQHRLSNRRKSLRLHFDFKI